MCAIVPQAIAPATATSLFAYSVESQILSGNLIWVLFFAFGQRFLSFVAHWNLFLTYKVKLATVAALQALSLEEPKHDWRKAEQEAAQSKAPSEA